MLNLAVFRKARGISQRALAKEIGVSEITLIRWEKQRTAPNVKQLAKLCEVLGVGLNDLYTIEVAH